MSLFFIISQESYGQSKALLFQHITTETGLPSNTIYDIIQDNVGYIWIASEAGLIRYDGNRFKTYNGKTSNLIGEGVLTIYEDGKNELWIGNEKGISKFNKSTELFENFSIDDSSFNVSAIYEDKKNRLWIGTSQGVFLFDRKAKKIIANWTNFPLKKELDLNHVNSIYQDSKNRIWISTENGVFLIFMESNHEVKNIMHFINDPNNDASLKNNRINAVKEDNNGSIWLATRKGLCKLSSKIEANSEEVTFIKIQNPYNEDVEYFDMIYSVTVDDKNGLWFGYLGGVYYLESDSAILENVDVITENSLLKHNYSIKTKFIDQSGVLWIATENGIYLHDTKLNKFKAYRANQDNIESRRQNKVWSILKDKNEVVWIGTTYGLNKLVWSGKSETYEYEYIPNNTEDNTTRNKNSVTTLFELDDNYLLIGSGAGLFKFNKHSLHFTNIPIKIENAFSLDSNDFKTPSEICRGKNGVVWIGTHKGLLKYNTNNNTFKAYKLPVIPNSAGNNIIDYINFDNKNRLWIGTHSGINVFFPDKEEFHYLNDDLDLEKASVWNIYNAKDGTVWYVTYGAGLHHIIPKNNKLNFEDGCDKEEFHVEDGLSNEYMYSILPDEEENFWMSTNKGISKFNPSTKLFENYTAEDGLQSNEFNSGAFFKADDGELLFGGPSGINRFYPSDISKNMTVPNVVITGVKVNGENIKMIYDLTLKYDQNPVKFEFAALSYNKSSENSYLVKLENHDESWGSLENQTSVAYSKLLPNDYIFKVKGANSDGTWNPNVTSYKLTVTPPYWKTWWFYMLYGVFSLSIIYLIFKVRLNQVKLKAKKEYFEKQNEEKIALLKEIHHRMKNNLQIVNSLLKFQSREIEDEKIIRMFKDAQNRVLSMSLLHEKMYNSKNLKNIDIKEHLTLLISDLVKSYVVGNNVKLDVDIEDVDIGMRTLIPIGLIINEIITNALKYAFKFKKGGTITVNLKQLDAKLYELVIGDDGEGYSLEKKAEGLGTKLIQIFTKQLNGTMTKQNQPGTFYKLVFEKID
jgi:two-component sensor histidine kinase/ligand-binding sensor domain-containing protein